MRGTVAAAFLLAMQHRNVLAAFFIGTRVFDAAISKYRSFLCRGKTPESQVTVIHSHWQKANLPFC
jgi:hypothetical protein